MIKIYETTVNEISNMNFLRTSTEPLIIKVNNMIKKEEFIDIFGDVLLDFSNNGISTVINGKTTIKDCINSDNYIFHDIVKSDFFNTMESVFPRFKEGVKYIKSRIYCGSSGTGSHFHYHPAALNYLISGIKLWIMIPPSLKNAIFYYKYISYRSSNLPLFEWLDLKSKELFDNVDDMMIFIQSEGSVVYVPDGYFHFVVNLTEVIGITYSWENI